MTANTDTRSGQGGASLPPMLYEGKHPVRQDGEMVSLTDMWRAAGADPQQTPAKWRSLPTSKAFVDHVETVVGKSDNALFRSRRGGPTQGTWAHWHIAMAYAKYLSPAFHAWCNTIVRAHMEALRTPRLEHDDVAEALARIQGELAARPGGVTAEEIREMFRAYSRWERRHYDRIVSEGYKSGGKVIRELGTQPSIASLGDDVDLDAGYRACGVEGRIPARNRLSGSVTNMVDAYCRKRRIATGSIMIGGKQVKVWPQQAFLAWYCEEGRNFIAAHIRRHAVAEQGAIEFPERQTA